MRAIHLILGAVAIGAMATLTMAPDVNAGDGNQYNHPTITATVTLPPKHSGGNDHPAPDAPPQTAPPSVCTAYPAPAGPEVADRYNATVHHRTATGLGIIEILYYSEQNSLHRYNVDRDRF